MGLAVVPLALSYRLPLFVFPPRASSFKVVESPEANILPFSALTTLHASYPFPHPQAS